MVTVPTAVMGWWGAAVRSSVVWRVIAVAMACVATAVVVKNLLDVGWFGHDPIFP